MTLFSQKSRPNYRKRGENTQLTFWIFQRLKISKKSQIIEIPEKNIKKRNSPKISFKIQMYNFSSYPHMSENLMKIWIYLLNFQHFFRKFIKIPNFQFANLRSLVESYLGSIWSLLDHFYVKMAKIIDFNQKMISKLSNLPFNPIPGRLKKVQKRAGGVNFTPPPTFRSL